MDDLEKGAQALETHRRQPWWRRGFAGDTAGAVTVDFIVITAAIVVLGTVIVGMTRGGQTKVAEDINVALSAVPVN